MNKKIGMKQNWAKITIAVCLGSVRKLPAEDVDEGKKLKSWETRLVHGRRRCRRRL